ncbi:MAG TPA: carboxypeptidase-like regulatory domain-containing protein [Gemmatimonadales bacterium]|nr:carboxypeptidase-like regulatory domain-containing protein [Gemmatimonadales bacterium]
MQAHRWCALAIALSLVSAGRLAAQGDRSHGWPWGWFQHGNDKDCKDDHRGWGSSRDCSHDKDAHDAGRQDPHGNDKDKDCDKGKGGGTGSGGTGGSAGGVGGTPQPATISGSVAGDNGAVADWQIFLISSTGASQSTKTAGDGTFSFTGVAAGTYMLCEADPSPAAEQIPAAGSASNSTACTGAYAAFGYSVTVAAGATSAGNSFLNGSGGVF